MYAITNFLNDISYFLFWLQYISAADSTVYVVDPASSATEQAESDKAAKRLR